MSKTTKSTQAKKVVKEAKSVLLPLSSATVKPKVASVPVYKFVGNLLKKVANDDSAPQPSVEAILDYQQRAKERMQEQDRQRRLDNMDQTFDGLSAAPFLPGSQSRTPQYNSPAVPSHDMSIQDMEIRRKQREEAAALKRDSEIAAEKGISVEQYRAERDARNQSRPAPVRNNDARDPFGVLRVTTDDRNAPQDQAWWLTAQREIAKLINRYQKMSEDGADLTAAEQYGQIASDLESSLNNPSLLSDEFIKAVKDINRTENEVTNLSAKQKQGIAEPEDADKLENMKRMLNRKKNNLHKVLLSDRISSIEGDISGTMDKTLNHMTDVTGRDTWKPSKYTTDPLNQDNPFVNTTKMNENNFESLVKERLNSLEEWKQLVPEMGLPDRDEELVHILSDETEDDQRRNAAFAKILMMRNLGPTIDNKIRRSLARRGLKDNDTFMQTKADFVEQLYDELKAGSFDPTKNNNLASWILVVLNNTLKNDAMKSVNRNTVSKDGFGQRQEDGSSDPFAGDQALFDRNTTSIGDSQDIQNLRELETGEFDKGFVEHLSEPTGNPKQDKINNIMQQVFQHTMTEAKQAFTIRDAVKTVGYDENNQPIEKRVQWLEPMPLTLETLPKYVKDPETGKPITESSLKRILPQMRELYTQYLATKGFNFGDKGLDQQEFVSSLFGGKEDSVDKKKVLKEHSGPSDTHVMIPPSSPKEFQSYLDSKAETSKNPKRLKALKALHDLYYVQNGNISREIPKKNRNGESFMQMVTEPVTTKTGREELAKRGINLSTDQYNDLKGAMTRLYTDWLTKSKLKPQIEQFKAKTNIRANNFRAMKVFARVKNNTKTAAKKQVLASVRQNAVVIANTLSRATKVPAKTIYASVIKALSEAVETKK